MAELEASPCVLFSAALFIADLRVVSAVFRRVDVLRGVAGPAGEPGGEGFGEVGGGMLNSVRPDLVGRGIYVSEGPSSSPESMIVRAFLLCWVAAALVELAVARLLPLPLVVADA